MAALDENYDDGFVAPLERNANNQTIPEENGKFPKINWSDVGSQIGKELTQQLTNTSHLAPEAIQQSPVKKNQLPIVLNEVPKPRSQSDQQTMGQNNERKAATADCSERKLPGKLETKSKPEIRQRLVTSLPNPSQPSEIQAYDQPQSEEKHNLSGTSPFPNAVRRTKSRITADTDVIVDLCTEGNIEKSSDPDPSQPQQSPSAGSESTADNKEILPECMPDSIKTTGEIPPLAAEQCNITNKQAKPRDLTVTAQLNGQDIKLLVDTGAGMSVIDEQFAQEVYRGELPELQKSALINVKTVSGEELPVLGKIKVILGIAGGKYPCELQVVKNLTYDAVLGRNFLIANGAVINLRQGTLQFEDSPSRGENAASIATFSEASNKQTPELLKEIRRMENGFTEKLENLNQRMDRINRLARRNSTVCYRCGRTGHIQYNCYSYYQPESPTHKQEDSQEFHAHYSQEENKGLATCLSARLSADSQYPQRVLNRHVNKAKSLEAVEQTSHQPVHTCSLTFEGGENSPDHALAALPKQEKINSHEKVASAIQLQQNVKPTRANKQQPQISHKQVPLPTTHYRQSKPSNDFHSCKKDFKLKCNDLTTEGEIAGQVVQLLVDTGACVSAIDELLFTKIYGHFPPIMSKGSLSSVQTVSGEKVPLLGKITIPLQLQEREYTCEFHVMQNLAHDAVLGRDFLRKNGALIDLVDSTLSFKGTAYVEDHVSTKTVPVMGTFLSQQMKLKEENAVASHVNVVPCPEILKPKFVQRSKASKLMSCHQSLILLMLIVLYLLTASCAPPIESNDKPVIQKLPRFFTQRALDDIPQDGHVICIPVSLSNHEKSDQSVDPNERNVPRFKALKAAVSLMETGDIQETLKSMFHSSTGDSYPLRCREAREQVYH